MILNSSIFDMFQTSKGSWQDVLDTQAHPAIDQTAYMDAWKK